MTLISSVADIPRSCQGRVQRARLYNLYTSLAHRVLSPSRISHLHNATQPSCTSNETFEPGNGPNGSPNGSPMATNVVLVVVLVIRFSKY